MNTNVKEVVAEVEVTFWGRKKQVCSELRQSQINEDLVDDLNKLQKIDKQKNEYALARVYALPHNAHCCNNLIDALADSEWMNLTMEGFDKKARREFMEKYQNVLSSTGNINMMFQAVVDNEEVKIVHVLCNSDLEILVVSAFSPMVDWKKKRFPEKLKCLPANMCVLTVREKGGRETHRETHHPGMFFGSDPRINPAGIYEAIKKRHYIA